MRIFATIFILYIFSVGAEDVDNPNNPLVQNGAGTVELVQGSEESVDVEPVDSKNVYLNVKSFTAMCETIPASF